MKAAYFIIATLVLFSLVLSVRSENQLPESKSLTQPDEEGSSLSFRDKEIYEMIEMLREVHLFQELQLSESKATEVMQKVHSIRELKRDYLHKRYTLENVLSVELGYAAIDQGKINTILQILETAKHEYYQQLLSADRELQDLLTTEERAKYVLFQRNFNQKLKEIIISIRQENINLPQQHNQILRKQPSESVIRQAK
ncbi:MAG: hypothetical protein RBT80_08890 [Candidatus Vecturithrix sp.]|jgi:hypothetical protein|nr:hypothetical protein [Candidatus Vecturithrix sp.]